MNNFPIGVFDSGIGGLTILKELIDRFPKESFIYLGDTARVPYGTRDKETIVAFSKELVEFMNKQSVKALVVACNTMSAVSLPHIREFSSVSVLDVISPTVKHVATSFGSQRIGVIGTRSTIGSKAYETLFREIGIQIESRACPMFVPLAEEGMLESKATEVIANEYLEGLAVDCLILGCTHYPLFKKIIGRVVGPKVKLVDSAHPTSEALLSLLTEEGLLSAETNRRPTYKLLVTDDPERTEMIARLFFDNKLPAKLQKISI